MFRSAKKFFMLPPGEKRLFLEALWQLFRCKFMLLFFSFKAYADRNPPVQNTRESSINNILAIRVAIRRASKLTFWSNKCLVETFAARKMLNKRGIFSKAFLGIDKKNAGRLNAHAWIMAGNIYVVKTEERFVEVHAF